MTNDIVEEGKMHVDIPFESTPKRQLKSTPGDSSPPPYMRNLSTLDADDIHAQSPTNEEDDADIDFKENDTPVKQLRVEESDEVVQNSSSNAKVQIFETMEEEEEDDSIFGTEKPFSPLKAEIPQAKQGPSQDDTQDKSQVKKVVFQEPRVRSIAMLLNRNGNTRTATLESPLFPELKEVRETGKEVKKKKPQPVARKMIVDSDGEDEMNQPTLAISDYPKPADTVKSPTKASKSAPKAKVVKHDFPKVQQDDMEVETLALQPTVQPVAQPKPTVAKSQVVFRPDTGKLVSGTFKSSFSTRSGETIKPWTESTTELLNGIHVIISGIRDEQLATLTKLIKSHGGEIVNARTTKAEVKKRTGKRGAKKVATKMQEKMSHVLLANEPLRTLKYVTAIAQNIPCLHYQWLLDSVKAGKLINAAPYLLAAGVDPVTERVFKQ